MVVFGFLCAFILEFSGIYVLFSMGYIIYGLSLIFAGFAVAAILPGPFFNVNSDEKKVGLLAFAVLATIYSLVGLNASSSDENIESNNVQQEGFEKEIVLYENKFSKPWSGKFNFVRHIKHIKDEQLKKKYNGAIYVPGSENERKFTLYHHYIPLDLERYPIDSISFCIDTFSARHSIIDVALQTGVKKYTNSIRLDTNNVKIDSGSIYYNVKIPFSDFNIGSKPFYGIHYCVKSMTKLLFNNAKLILKHNFQDSLSGLNDTNSEAL